MSKKINFDILKKLNLLKGYLVAPEFEVNSIIEIFDELFGDDIPEEIQQVRLKLFKGNKLESLNLLNNLKETTAKSLFKNPCPQQWYSLIDTSSSNIKFCSDCNKNVYLVSTEEEFVKRKNLEQCVAINAFDVNILDENDKNYKACHIKFEEAYLLGLPNQEIWTE